MTKPTETDKILAAMMTENTGRHMLDSGGAYGRQWERNLAVNPERSPEPYLAQPSAWFSSGKYVTLSTFHYLRDRLTYLPRADRELERYGTTAPPGMDYDDYSDENKSRWDWGRTSESFLSLVRVQHSHWSDYANSGYTYNHENSLSQDFVWISCDVRICWTHMKFHLAPSGKPIKGHTFKDPEPLEDDDTKLEPGTGPFPDCDWQDVTVASVQLHGGCDARGGFTQARLFLLDDGDHPLGYEIDEYELFCNHTPEPGDPDYVDPLQPPIPGATWPEKDPYADRHYLSYRGGEWMTPDGDSYRDPWSPSPRHETRWDKPGEPHRCNWNCTTGITPTVLPYGVDDRYPAGAPERVRTEPIPMWADDSDSDAAPRGSYGDQTSHWINCPWCGRRMSVEAASY